MSFVLEKACVDNPGPNSEYDVNDLYVMARDHMGEIQANPIQNVDGLDPGFVSSFWVYPLAEAHSYVFRLGDLLCPALIAAHFSILGFVHFRKAMENVNKPEVAAPDFRKASEWYIEAAGHYPVDDEKHIRGHLRMPPYSEYIIIDLVYRFSRHRDPVIVAMWDEARGIYAFGEACQVGCTTGEGDMGVFAAFRPA